MLLGFLWKLAHIKPARFHLSVKDIYREKKRMYMRLQSQAPYFLVFFNVFRNVLVFKTSK